MVKADGCVAIHADVGAYKPVNWMNAPNTLIEEPDGRWVVTNPKGETLTIELEEVVSDIDRRARHRARADPRRRREASCRSCSPTTRATSRTA